MYSIYKKQKFIFNEKNNKTQLNISPPTRIMDILFSVSISKETQLPFLLELLFTNTDGTVITKPIIFPVNTQTPQGIQPVTFFKGIFIVSSIEIKYEGTPNGKNAEIEMEFFCKDAEDL